MPGASLPACKVLERHYAAMFDGDEGGGVRLVERVPDEVVLADERFAWEFDRKYKIELCVVGTAIETYVDRKKLFGVQDSSELPLTGERSRLSWRAVLSQPNRCAFAQIPRRDARWNSLARRSRLGACPSRSPTSWLPRWNRLEFSERG